MGEILQTQFYVNKDFLINNSNEQAQLCTLLNHKGYEVLNFDSQIKKLYNKLPTQNKEEGKAEWKSYSIINNLKYNNDFLSQQVKKYLNSILKIDSDKIGLITNFKFIVPLDKKSDITYGLSDDFQNLIRVNKNKKHQYNFENEKWEKVK